MCYMVYLASENPLQEIEYNPRVSPLFIDELDRKEEVVSKHFTNRNLYYVGANGGCGCDVANGLKSPKFEHADVLIPLQNYLREALVENKVVEMFICWDGEQEDNPEERICCSVNNLLSTEILKGDSVYCEIRNG